MGCTVAEVSAQRPLDHVKNALQNITTDCRPHSVFEGLLTVDAASVDDGCADARHSPGGAVRVAGGRLAHADDGAVEHRDELVRSHLVHV